MYYHESRHLQTGIASSRVHPLVFFQSAGVNRERALPCLRPILFLPCCELFFQPSQDRFDKRYEKVSRSRYRETSAMNNYTLRIERPCCLENGSACRWADHYSYSFRQIPKAWCQNNLSPPHPL